MTNKKKPAHNTNNNAGFWWFADKILSSLSCSTGDNETKTIMLVPILKSTDH